MTERLRKTWGLGDLETGGLGDKMSRYNLHSLSLSKGKRVILGFRSLSLSKGGYGTETGKQRDGENGKIGR